MTTTPETQRPTESGPPVSTEGFRAEVTSTALDQFLVISVLCFRDSRNKGDEWCPRTFEG